MTDTLQPFDNKEGLFREEDFTNEQRKVWESIADGMPSTEAVFDPDGPILRRWMDHLYKRFATFMVWNIDIDKEEEGKAIDLDTLGEHFEAFDFGSWLMMHPKDLFSHQRSDDHARQAARALMHYVHEVKQWSRVELGGHNDLIKVANIAVNALNYQQPERRLQVWG